MYTICTTTIKIIKTRFGKKIRIIIILYQNNIKFYSCTAAGQNTCTKEQNITILIVFIIMYVIQVFIVYIIIINFDF